MIRPTLPRRQMWVLSICLLAGLLLSVIGVRYIVSPNAAARTFGLVQPLGSDLHTIIGLRNVWLGLLAMGFAIMRQWSALALWFGFGTVVCFADAAIAATSSGRLAQIVFHVGSGIVCLALTLVILRMARWGET